MFDVAWTEPVETLGQRKTRKDKQAKRLSQASSVISSKSCENITSPTQPRPSLLGIFGHKKGILHRSVSTSRLSTLRSETTTNAANRVSSYTACSDSSNQESSGLKSNAKISPNKYFDEGRRSNADTDISSPSDDSVFSRWNARSSTATASSWASNLNGRKGEKEQPQDRNYYGTQSTEIPPRDDFKKDVQIATLVHISSAGTLPLHITNPSASPHLAPMTSIFNFPIPPLKLTEPSVLPQETGNVENRVVLRPEEPPVETWQTLEACQCPSAKVEPTLVPPRNSQRRIRVRKDLPRSSELTHLQTNIRKMSAASPKIILERLKEEWIGVVDGSIYRELELERQLWTLSALRALDAEDDSVAYRMEAVASASTKILSLYENKASSSFLSASNPSLDIHHLSTSPILPKHYPNVRPLAIPRLSTHLPYASNSFASIHAFSLPALIPASSIPALLKECERILISSHPPNNPATYPTSVTNISELRPGSLQLTILDPLPIYSTLGPILRAWLDTHLIVNLERQFRCTNPARLLPIWLADAGLRGQGSTISSVRFLASISHESDGFSMIDGAGQEQGIVSAACTKQELQSVVGRLLWKEMWGQFVEGEKWWWEDEKVVEECESLGTYWEYAIIHAVKEG